MHLLVLSFFFSKWAHSYFHHDKFSYYIQVQHKIRCNWTIWGASELCGRWVGGGKFTYPSLLCNFCPNLIKLTRNIGCGVNNRIIFKKETMGAYVSIFLADVSKNQQNIVILVWQLTFTPILPKISWYPGIWMETMVEALNNISNIKINNFCKIWYLCQMCSVIMYFIWPINMWHLLGNTL